MPICAYCKRDTELCDSHAIPNGFFKSISRHNNGKLIAIPKGEGCVHLSQQTGKAKLLCQDCEGLFNREFDSPLVNAFKDWDRQIAEKGFSVRLEFLANKMAQGLASICWRASVSGNGMYTNAQVSSRDKAGLLSIVEGDQNKVLKNCSCYIKRFYDKQGGFSQDDISQIIVPVNAYRLEWGGKKRPAYFAFTIVMQGFLCALQVPRLPFHKRRGSEFLNPKKDLLHAPPLYIMDYRPLMEIMAVGFGKNLEGKSTLPQKEKNKNTLTKR